MTASADSPSKLHVGREGGRVRLLLAAAAAVVLGGCATFSRDEGFDRVAELTRERTGHAPAWQRSSSDTEIVRVRIDELLARTLTPDAAVEIALLGHPGLQAAFEDLGIAEAERVRAGRIRNPTLSFARQKGGGHLEIERAIVFDLLALATLPLSYDIEQKRFAQTQLEVAARTVAIANEARHAYFGAVAAAELVRYYEQVKETAEVSSELARRMVEAGNFSKLARMREQAFYAEATAQLARSRHQATAERERLARALGLAGSQLAFRLPERLPEPPATPVDPQAAERTAIEQRLDVQAAKRGVELLAQSLGLTKATGLVNVLHVGYANTSETGERRRDGFEIELELPIFDFGVTRLARAEAQYRQALQRTAEVAINARSQVREAYSAYRTSYDLAQHYRAEIVPLRKRISEENLLRYNGMLIGVFELLADARDQVASVTGAVEATREFWLAHTTLQTVLLSGPPGQPAFIRPTNAPAAGGGAGH